MRREEIGRKLDDKYKSKSERGSSESFKAQGKGGFLDDESRIAPANAPMESMSEISMEEDKALYFKEGQRSDFARDQNRRQRVRQFFRTLDKTEEWVENNYYHIPIESQLASLVTVNAFWKDYAAHPGNSPFLSPHVLQKVHIILLK